MRFLTIPFNSKQFRLIPLNSRFETLLKLLIKNSKVVIPPAGQAEASGDADVAGQHLTNRVEAESTSRATPITWRGVSGAVHFIRESLAKL